MQKEFSNTLFNKTLSLNKKFLYKAFVILDEIKNNSHSRNNVMEKINELIKSQEEINTTIASWSEEYSKSAPLSDEKKKKKKSKGRKVHFLIENKS